jgi:hypothetical protein
MNNHPQTTYHTNPKYFLTDTMHSLLLTLYMIAVIFHFFEHVLQICQAFVLHWARADSGGLLGLWAPQLLASELLHFGYNLFQLVGLAVLLKGFAGRAQRWWAIALAIQTWHFIEHTVMLVQAQTSLYLFGASKPMSLLEVLLPRIELHFLYNALVFVPTAIAVFLYWRSGSYQLRRS